MPKELPIYEIDNLDRSILRSLLRDARTPFSDIAQELGVSDGTIHVRVNKLKQAGVITGAHIAVDHRALGYSICAFIGINLEHARDYEATVKKLKNIDRITEAYYTTGHYNILTKVLAHDMDDLYRFLVEVLQSIEKVQSTETLLVLNTPIARHVKV